MQNQSCREFRHEASPNGRTRNSNRNARSDQCNVSTFNLDKEPKLKEIELACVARNKLKDQQKASFQNKSATDRLMRNN